MSLQNFCYVPVNVKKSVYNKGELQVSVIQKRDLEQYKIMAQASCKAWGFKDNLELIRNGENVTFKIKTSAKNYGLRITDKQHRSALQIHAELDWMSFLSDGGVSVAKPIRASNGEFIFPINNCEKEYFSSVFEWADGKAFNSEDHLNEEFISSYGSLVGKMHKLTKTYDNSHLSQKRKCWAESKHSVQAESLIGAYNKKMVNHWVEAKSWYDSLPKTQASYGLAHIDLHFGNFHINNNKELTIFDFDDSAYCFYIYDIVVPLLSLKSVQTNQFTHKKIKELFLNSYLSENTLSKIWIDRIPCFLRLRNIEVYAWVLLMYGESKEPHHKDFLNKIESSMSKPMDFV